jgi:hypothetical protein
MVQILGVIRSKAALKEIPETFQFAIQSRKGGSIPGEQSVHNLSSGVGSGSGRGQVFTFY